MFEHYTEPKWTEQVIDPLDLIFGDEDFGVVELYGLTAEQVDKGLMAPLQEGLREQEQEDSQDDSRPPATGSGSTSTDLAS